MGFNSTQNASTVDYYAVIYWGPKVFAEGQAYVALSRVKSLKGFQIKELDSWKTTGKKACNNDWNGYEGRGYEIIVLHNFLYNNKSLKTPDICFLNNVFIHCKDFHKFYGYWWMINLFVLCTVYELHSLPYFVDILTLNIIAENSCYLAYTSAGYI